MLARNATDFVGYIPSQELALQRKARFRRGRQRHILEPLDRHIDYVGVGQLCIFEILSDATMSPTSMGALNACEKEVSTPS